MWDEAVNENVNDKLRKIKDIVVRKTRDECGVNTTLWEESEGVVRA